MDDRWTLDKWKTQINKILDEWKFWMNDWWKNLTKTPGMKVGMDE
jgi:hypothetical protein